MNNEDLNFLHCLFGAPPSGHLDILPRVEIFYFNDFILMVIQAHILLDMVEQDHWTSKRDIRHMRGFKSESVQVQRDINLIQPSIPLISHEDCSASLSNF